MARLNFRGIAVASAVALSVLVVPARAGEGSDVVRVAGDGHPIWTFRPADPPLEGTSTPLDAPPWFERLPDVGIPLAGGGRLSAADLRGRVVLIDFWASWCEPCLVELPRLEKLWREEEGGPLLAVAVNNGEGEEIARQAAARIGLSMPIGLYDDALDSAFSVRSLPTVILADREGRIRERWNGYAPGLEDRIARRTRELLGIDLEGRPKRVGRVRLGGGRFEALWTRELHAPVGGLAAIEGPNGERLLLASTSGRIVVLEPDGAVVGWVEGPDLAGRLVVGPIDADGTPGLFSFRVGGAELARIDLAAGRTTPLRVPSAILDARVVPPREGDHPARVAVATVDGLFWIDPMGAGHPVPVLEGAASGLGVTEDGGVVVALAGGALLAVAGDGAVTGRREAPEGAWSILPGASWDDGIATAPRTILAAASGRFAPDEGLQLALLTESREIVVLDASTGAARFRASWPGAEFLTASDLDGDGLDDLAVGEPRRVSLLRAVSGTRVNRAENANNEDQSAN